METGHKNGFIEFAISLVKQLLGSYKAETGHSQPSKYLVLKASPNHLGQILAGKPVFGIIGPFKVGGNLRQRWLLRVATLTEVAPH